ncbi:hypothetical protein BHM03_00043071 [Ensete ventricosum]|nr:hypothetical protein BHM03_00043071 [Ensete ventricosum]
MVRSGAPRRGKGTRSVPPSPLRRNSRRPVGNHAGSAPSLQPISSLVTPSPKLNTTSNMSFVNDTANVSSLPDHSSGGGRAVAAGGLMATSGNFQRQSGGGGAPDVLGPAKFDPRAFTSSSPTAQGPQPHNLYSRRISLDHSQPYQLSMMQNFQGSSSMPHMQRQKELREELGNVGSTAFVNMEPQMGSSDQNVLLLLSQSPSHTGTVNLEPHQLYSGRGLGPGKMESEHSYSALFLQQQPQPQQLQEQELFKKPRPRPKAASPHISMQQQLLQMPRPPSQAASAQISPQQQQILRSIPQQQDQLRPVQPKVKSTLIYGNVKYVIANLLVALICSWEFCARHHEEFIPRRLFMPQVSTDAFVQTTCAIFVVILLTETAGQLVKAFEVPVVNDLANKKCYLSCLQVGCFLEVLDSMKDLIDYSIQTGTGPIDSLINFPKRIASSSVLHSQQVQQPDGQYTSQCDQTSAHATGVQLLSASSSLTSVANTLNNIPSTCTTTTTAGLLHLNFRHDNWTSNVNGPHTGNTVPTPPASSISWRLSHPNVFPPTPSSIPSTSNNIVTSSVNIGHLNSGNLPVITSIMKQPLAQSQEANPTESPSVDRTLQEMMTSQHTGVSSLGHEGVSGTGSGIIGEIRPSKTAGTSRGEMAKNTVAMNEQAGINYRSDDPSDVIHQQQEDMNRLFDGLEPLDNLDILQLIQELSP